MSWEESDEYFEVGGVYGLIFGDSCNRDAPRVVTILERYMLDDFFVLDENGTVCRWGLIRAFRKRLR